MEFNKATQTHLACLHTHIAYICQVQIQLLIQAFAVTLQEFQEDMSACLEFQQPLHISP